MDEDEARLWTVVFGAITSLGLIAAGVYSLIQFEDGRQKDREAQRFQAAATDLSARQYFNNKLLDNCTAASSETAIIAKGQGPARQEVVDTFGALSNGPMKIIAGFQVERAIKEFKRCLDEASNPRSGCASFEKLADDVAWACKLEVKTSFTLQEDPNFNRPKE